jgi:hypothetical protein
VTAAAASESERGKEEEEEEGAQQTNRRKKGQQIKKGKLFFFFFFFALVVASHYTAIMSFGMSVLSITFGVLCCLPPRPCRFHLFFFFCSSSLTQRQSPPSPFSSSPSNLNRRQCLTGRKEGRRKKSIPEVRELDPFIFKGPLRDKRGNTPRN